MNLAREAHFRGFGIVVLAVALAGSAAHGTFNRWRNVTRLKGELELAKLDAAELEGLRKANADLRTAHVSAAEIRLLRAEREDLARLRAELHDLEHNPPHMDQPSRSEPWRR